MCFWTFCNEIPQTAVFCYWQVVLLVGAEWVVDVPLQVDGQVRDPEQRPGHMNQLVNQPAVLLEEDNIQHTHKEDEEVGNVCYDH